MYRIIAVCLLLLITACGEADRVPKDVISKEQMRDVLLDLNLADAYSGITDDQANLLVHDSIRQKRVKVYFRQVLDMHKLTPEQFNHSYQYYEAHPNAFKVIYDMMFAIVSNDKNMLDINERRKEYVTNRRNLLPVNNNSLISIEQDTLIPFVKKNKRGINFDNLPKKLESMPKDNSPKKHVPLNRLAKPKR
ncbi:DUF4296 domain-containing protein [Chitinophaga sp. S165]|uniref:DUF4296 domain-containing protein n=1 Tax=Chitinophaga sp. S165 TaxID=2135462 RepID=UPI000D70B9E1|nr:DUF4296 domain-containing protein [Chitinophaga sp. S165]PWV47460.1 uncharacterized protein DUF4296 [Chitinophaga sp. S165]